MKRLMAISLILSGLTFFAWTSFGTSVVASHHEAKAHQEIVTFIDAGRQPRVTIAGVKMPGVGLLTIHAAEIKAAPIVTGYGTEVLNRGLLGSTGVRPGETGNLTLLAHVVGHGAVFKNLDDLRKGDRITIKTSRGTCIYRVRTSAVTVDKTARWVFWPIPSQNPDVDPTVKPVLALLTCTSSLFRTDQRLLVIADLVKGTPNV